MEERCTFVINWKKKNKYLLESQLGSKRDDLKFVHGVFFAPSFTTETVPLLQRLFMADACHLNFGKYTLFTCYGVTANASMSPVAFGTVFRNENGNSWGAFWEFVKKLHPTIDMGDVTVITDQDKGQMNAISDWIPLAGHFHCSHHCRGNIIKYRGGGSGKIKYSALWMYNKLMGCRMPDCRANPRDKGFLFSTHGGKGYRLSKQTKRYLPVSYCPM